MSDDAQPLRMYMVPEIRRRVRWLQGNTILNHWSKLLSCCSLDPVGTVCHLPRLVVKSLVELLSAGSCSSFIRSWIVPYEGANRAFIGDQYAQTQNHRAHLARWRHPDEQQSGRRFPIRRLDRTVSLACRVTNSKRDVRQDLRLAAWPPNLRHTGEFLAESAEESDDGPP